MPEIINNRRRRRYRRRTARTWPKVAAFAVYVAVCFAAGYAAAFREAAAFATEIQASVDPGVDATHVQPAVVAPKDGRANYNYSVIPGGARNPQELAHAMQTDSVVAEHYRDVDPSTMRPERVSANRLAYVSYRKNDQVFWTKNKVRIYEGETILTDGDREIRGRCGNAISMAPSSAAWWPRSTSSSATASTRW